MLSDNIFVTKKYKKERPHPHPNQHTQEELDLIRHKHPCHRHGELAQVQ